MQDATIPILLKIRLSNSGTIVAIRSDTYRNWYDRLEFDVITGYIHVIAIRGSEWSESEFHGTHVRQTFIASQFRSCRSQGERGFLKKWTVKTKECQSSGDILLQTYIDAFGQSIIKSQKGEEQVIYSGAGSKKLTFSSDKRVLLTRITSIETVSKTALSYATKDYEDDEGVPDTHSSTSVSTRIRPDGTKLTRTVTNKTDNQGNTTQSSVVVEADYTDGSILTQASSTDGDGTKSTSYSLSNGSTSESKTETVGQDGSSLSSSTLIKTVTDSSGGTEKTTTTTLSGSDGDIIQITTESPDGTIQTDRTITNPDGSGSVSRTTTDSSGSTTSTGANVDSNGNVTQTTTSVADGQGNTTTSTTTPDGQGGTTTTTTTTDSAGNGTSTTTTTDSSGNTTSDTQAVEGAGTDASGSSGDSSGGGRPDPSGGGGMPSDDGEVESPGRPTWGAFGALVENTDWDDDGQELPPNRRLSQSLVASFINPTETMLANRGPESVTSFEHTLPRGDFASFGPNLEYVEDTRALTKICALLAAAVLMRGQGLTSMRNVEILKRLGQCTLWR